MKFLGMLLAFVMNSNMCYAKTSSTSQKMDFDKCVLLIDKTVNDIGIPFNVIVNTKIVRIVKIVTTDGVILLTCSKLDKNFTTTVTQ